MSLEGPASTCSQTYQDPPPTLLWSPGDPICRPPIVHTPNDVPFQAVENKAYPAEPSAIDLGPQLLAGLLSEGYQHNDRKIKLDRQEVAMQETQETWKMAKGTPSPNESNPRENIRFSASATSLRPLGGKDPPRQDRQDSSYYSIQGEDDYADPGPATKKHRRISRSGNKAAILHGRVVRTRRMLRDRRGKLHELREKFRDVTDKLTRKVNEMVAYDCIRDELAPYHEQLREAQDALGVAEAEYDVMETTLEQEERELDMEELHFHDPEDMLSPSITDSDSDTHLSPLLRPDVPRETSSPTSSLEDDAIQGYLDKRSEAYYLKEDLDDLEEDYYQFSTDASLLDRLDRAPSAETASFFKDYRARHAELVLELQKAEAEMFRLRAHCIKDGLFHEEEYTYKPRDVLLEDVMDSIYYSEDRSPLRLAGLRVSDQDRRLDHEDKRETINIWLLTWIQDSPFECSRLREWVYSEYLDCRGSAEGLTDDTWADLALQHWDRDAAGAHTDDFYSASMLDVIAGPTRRVNASLALNASVDLSDFSGSWQSSDMYLDNRSRVKELVTGITAPINRPRKSLSL
ncbi:hypothetical protein BJ875DRAFT_138037 [Amylocarpus encephaloides]|uniref:Uncharacterized protein n=1 Tax=Amylocarpus encephaloides TaxID=45428 RepID=A0A9P7YCG3_9HELO|nr:hypothetical protein BJ875DRAFT_138037 [Amylocarpus encephaloides]